MSYFEGEEVGVNNNMWVLYIITIEGKIDAQGNAMFYPPLKKVLWPITFTWKNERNACVIR